MLWLVTLTFTASTAFALAPSVQQDWIFPAAPDGTSHVTLGSLTPISWTTDLQGWFSSYCPLCDPTKVDLWVQTGNDDNYAYKVATGVNVANSYSFRWPVDIPASDLVTDPEWVLRFIPYNASLTSTSQQISSAVFYIDAPASITSSSTTTTTTSTPLSSIALSATASNSQVAATSSSSPTTTSASASSTTSAAQTSAPSTGGLSTGAKAGVGAGVGVAALLFLGAVVLFTRSRRNREHQLNWLSQRQNSEKQPANMPGMPGQTFPGPGGSESPAQEKRKPSPHAGFAELSSGTLGSELPGDHHHLASELSGEERL